MEGGEGKGSGDPAEEGAGGYVGGVFGDCGGRRVLGVGGGEVRGWGRGGACLGSRGIECCDVQRRGEIEMAARLRRYSHMYLDGWRWTRLSEPSARAGMHKSSTMEFTRESRLRGVELKCAS